MKNIKLYMQRTTEDCLNFWLLKKLKEENYKKREPDFFLKRFDILELEKCLFSVEEYGLSSDDMEYTLDLKVGKSEYEDSIYIINNEKIDGLMLLKELNISSGGILGGGYSKLSNCIFLSRKISKIEVSNINIGTVEVISEILNSTISVNYASIKTFTSRAGYSAQIKNSSLQELTILDAPIEPLNLNLSLESCTVDSINGNNNYIKTFKIYKTIIKGGKILDTCINTFSIESSDFGEINFVNITFNKPARIIKSYIEKIGLFNTKWNKSLLDEKGASALDLKDSYRQLKYIYDKSSNKTEANKFFGKEMEYYEKSLSWIGEGDKKLVSNIQRYSNNYGNNWHIPILWMILLSLSSGMYIWSSNKRWNPFDIHGFFNLVLERILPISEITEFKSFLDLLYKIAWAFLIYQFIVALRRISQR